MTVRPRLLALSLTTALTMSACTFGSDDPKESGTTDQDSMPAAACSSGEAPSLGGKTSAFDAPVAVESSGALRTQVSEPAMSTTASPTDGYRIAQIKVSARVQTNGVFALHPESFVLADPDGQRCAQPATNPLRGALQVSQVDESKVVSGVVAFIVPAEANLSDYAVHYVDKPGSPKAIASWSGNGSAPSPATVNTCSTNRSGIKLAGAKDQEFYKPFTTGDDPISLAITPSTPWSRELKPGPNQPNDVRGVVVSLYVAAKGSVGYIERNQFQLIDDKGNLCRYNELGSDGENLTSDLVETDKPKRYTLVFWTPKGSEVAGWKLLYMPEPSDRKVTATWTLKPRASASNSPSSSASSSASVPSSSTATG